MIQCSENSREVCVLLSGGIDSTACIHFLIHQSFAVTGFFIDYGQLAKKFEEKSAKEICDFYKIKLNLCQISSNKTFKSGEIIGRNAFFIFLALMFSDLKQGIIAIGIHSGIPYDDCSDDFINQIGTIVKNYSQGRISLFAPFLDWTKNDILQYCKHNEVPIHLAYSCEAGSSPPCGQCNSCRDRQFLL